MLLNMVRRVGNIKYNISIGKQNFADIRENNYFY